MGVKDLWQVLSPVCERKSLWELQDKNIAVDLSCWVCDSQNVAEFSSQPNMYLRNLFFRTSALLLLGAHPVFVLEGTAPAMKVAVMDQRTAARGFTQSQSQANKGKRHQLKSIQKKCCEVLECIGVKFIQSEGEAEALCALLNKHGLVDGCISQDSDCFLYGAETVYRNFTTTSAGGSTGGPGFSVDLYSMTSIKKSLDLTRNKLIALSLLCGCDYQQQGVAGVGKESALKFIATIEDDAILDRLRQWREDFDYDQFELERNIGGCEQCGHIGKKKVHMKEGCSQCQQDKGCVANFNPRSLCQMDPEQRKTLVTELTIRKKALLDPEFPSEDIISEFSSPQITVPRKLDTSWGQPDLLKFIRLADRYLKWEETYAFSKFLPLLTRWILLQKGRAPKSSLSCPICPQEIKRTRVLRGVASYEIRWNDSAGLFDTILATAAEDSQIDSSEMLSTIEPQCLVEKAYPDLVDSYTTRCEEAKQAKKKSKSKSKKVTEKAEDNKKKCETCRSSKECLCRFTQKSNKENEPSTAEHHQPKVTKPQKRKTKPPSDARQRRLSSFLYKRQVEVTSTLPDIPLEQMLDASLNLQDFPCDYDEADLSLVVMSIVRGENDPISGGKLQDSATVQASTLLNPLASNIDVADSKSQKTDSSDEEFDVHIPLIERIKMKNRKLQLNTKTASCTVYASPQHKKSRFDKAEHPYSPLADYIDQESPSTSRRQSVLKTKAARRFSTSFQVFSSPTFDDHLLAGSSSPTNSDKRFQSDNRISLGLSALLDYDDQLE